MSSQPSTPFYEFISTRNIFIENKYEAQYDATNANHGLLKNEKELTK